MHSRNRVLIQGIESTIEIIPNREDNYIFLGRENGSQLVFVVDPGDAEPVLNILNKSNLTLGAILLTHEHDDHIGGVEQLMSHFPRCQCIGSPTLKKIVPSLGHRFQENRVTDFKIGKLNFNVLFCPGHTKDHYAYYLPNEEFLFSGDVLFGLACGRIFNGTHSEQYSSLRTMVKLPDTTKVFCAHEYTFKNLEFLIHKNQEFPESIRIKKTEFDATIGFIKNTLEHKMEKDHATVPLDLGFEKRYNPFLKCKTLAEFKLIRDLKDKF